jgi:two-component system phosphate regulon sensor histidine kinase PhoR
MAIFGREPTLEEALSLLRRRLDEKGPLPKALIELGQRLLQRESPRTFADPSLPEMVAAMPDAAGVIDGGGRFIAANRPLEVLLGSTVLGRSLLEATRSQELADAVWRALAGWPASREMTLPGPGKVAFALLAPLPQARALLVLRDLTEPKRQELIRRDFIANASHELRTPVSAISGAVETLLSGLPLADEARPFVEMIARHAERLGNLSSDLLDLSRLESGEVRPEMEPLDATLSMSVALELVRAKAAEKELELRVEGTPGLRVLADARALEQIFVNLLDNAIKYTKPRGRITMTSEARDGRVVLSVTDTGPGIEPRHLQRLFERFYRADPGRSRAAGGTGLGLAIVKHLTQLQGGEVFVESSAAGSRFWLRLRQG